MNLPNLPALEKAYETAVVCLLNACPDCTEEEAEAVIDSFTQLVFATMQAYLEEKIHEPAASH